MTTKADPMPESPNTPETTGPDGIFSLSSKTNSGITNTSYELRKIVAIEDRGHRGGYLSLIGECGHEIDVIPSANWSVSDWEQRIEAGKRNRKRCRRCPKANSGWK